MGALDNMYDGLGITDGQRMPKNAAEMRAQLTPAIKALFLETIGADDSTEYDELSTDPLIQEGYASTREGNIVRAQIRRKVTEL